MPMPIFAQKSENRFWKFRISKLSLAYGKNFSLKKMVNINETLIASAILTNWRAFREDSQVPTPRLL